MPKPIVDRADGKAEQAPCGQTRFVLNEKQWEEFTQLLDRPPIDKPRLRRLFEEEHVATRHDF